VRVRLLAPSMRQPLQQLLLRVSSGRLFTFQSENQSAVYRYYWWHDNCYVRYQSGSYQLVASDYCNH
jgi:hypothetical protein